MHGCEMNGGRSQEFAAIHTQVFGELRSRQIIKGDFPYKCPAAAQ